MKTTTAFVVMLCSVAGGAWGQVVHHQLSASLDPAEGSIRVEDTIQLAGAAAADVDGALRFVLHAGLRPEVLSEGWSLEPADGEVAASFVGNNATSGSDEGGVPLEGWRLFRDSAAEDVVRLRYGGRIHHPLATQGEEYQRSFSETPGLIDERGVFLAGASYWVPAFGEQLVSFELVVEGLTPPWDVVSQGRRTRHEVVDGVRTTAWSCPDPTEEIYLVAGPWHEYGDRAGDVELFAFLRDDDPALAQRYLAATKRYLKLYEGLLPSFPFASFALVENFWETGYGMPGFTLLGPKVIRFPWILTSSYPHELLHNWWGNSTYVDFESGNWCEGLTAYMADHLFAEQRGEGARYRRTTLQKYTDFVSAGNDFPLIDFRSRRSAASEAVGYGKSLMLFHMLRRAVGDEAFVKALAAFAKDHRFKRAGFADIAAAFNEHAGGDWEPFVEAWTGRAGAPMLEIDSLEVGTADAGGTWPVRLMLRQSGVEKPFPMSVPVAVTVDGSARPLWAEVGSCAETCSITISCPSRPLRLDVDPLFDVMRRLDPMEVPPALSTMFGAEQPLFVLPGDAAPAEQEAWQSLAAAWARPQQPRLVVDGELDDLPGGTVWLLGRGNRFADRVVDGLEAQGVRRVADKVSLPGEEFALAGHSLVLVARGAGDPGTGVAWVAADPVAAVGGLARKLPHYSRYSYLVFEGSEPANVAKGTWMPVSSPLVRNLGDGELPPLALTPRAPLAELPAVFDASALHGTVRGLAGEEYEGRGLGSDGLLAATEWVRTQLAAMGLAPVGEDGFRQRWSFEGGEPPRPMELVNLVGRLDGTDPALATQPVLVMAHLDHLGRGWPDVREGNEGVVHPGADDNASGVAVLLELARAMAAEPRRPRPVLFAVVTGEEAGLLGSRHLVEGMAEQLPFACLNLDTVGRLGDGKLLVLDADSAREWRFIFMGVGYTTGVPVDVVAQRLDASDQTACLERGVPAVQLFTGPHADYHAPSDTADRVDGEGMARVAEAAFAALAYLAERTEPLTVTIAGEQERPSHPSGAPRRASLGTMPDFSFSGPGVRVQQVMPGSAAATAGVRAGDVIVSLDGAAVEDLRGFSELLKRYEPGARVDVGIERAGEPLSVQAVLGAR